MIHTLKSRLSVLLAVALAGVWLVALGANQTAQVAWTAPTAYTDGSALPASDIASYTVSWVLNAKVQSVTVPGTALSATASVPCGTAQFSVTATTTATAAVPNATSAPGGPVPFATGVTCAPNPPTGLTVVPASSAVSSAAKKP